MPIKVNGLSLHMNNVVRLTLLQMHSRLKFLLKKIPFLKMDDVV